MRGTNWITSWSVELAKKHTHTHTQKATTSTLQKTANGYKIGTGKIMRNSRDNLSILIKFLICFFICSKQISTSRPNLFPLLILINRYIYFCKNLKNLVRQNLKERNTSHLHNTKLTILKTYLNVIPINVLFS